MSRRRAINFFRLLALMLRVLPPGLVQCRAACLSKTLAAPGGCHGGTDAPDAAQSHCPGCNQQESSRQVESAGHCNCSIDAESPSESGHSLSFEPNPTQSLAAEASPITAAAVLYSSLNLAAGNGTSPPGISSLQIYRLLGTLRI